ncbi:hypothetical protein [Nocardioides sp. R-C-SC26]|uniref:hypothetical protein n=1 Tax=Nocardioides sp. R-C-SC26 TaxID=2870414 RepID=UPI001E59380B|nr:hypothetical protein [Nocardioides sp. R-C-SC26]
MFLRGRRRNDRGAIAIIAAALAFGLVAIAAITVDIGMQRVARRDMQALADIVALDLSRELGARTVTQLSAVEVSLARESIARNAGTIGDPASITASDIEWGELDGAGKFVALSGTAIPTAVRVAAHTSVDFAFGLASSGGATRSAVATQDELACFQIGSYALAVNSGNSALLNGLIGDALGLGVISYAGLADASISLAGLAAELGAGSVDELADISAVSVGELMVASGTVLQNQGGDTADVTLLRNIPLGAGPLPNVTVGELVGLAPGGASALDASVNVLDLLATSAFIANGENLIGVNDLGLSLGLTAIRGGLKLVEAPKRACGRVNSTQRRTSQTSLTLGGDVVNVPSILGLSASVSLSLSADLASGRGTLTGIHCAVDGAAEGVDVRVQNALTEVALGLNVRLVGNLGLVKVEIVIPVSATTTESRLSSTAQVRVPPLSYTSNTPGAITSRPVPSGSGQVGLNGLAVASTPVVKATLLGVPVALPVPIGSIVGPVLNTIVNPLVQGVDRLLLGPLTGLLGLNVAGADVYGVASPECSGPILRG